MKVTQEMRDREPLRWCVYCDADCDADEPEHAEDCPSRTGVFTVDAAMIGPECPHCGERAGHPPICTDCAATLNVGDRYMLREIEPGDQLVPGVEGASVNEVVCVGCAAIHAVTGEAQ